MPLYKGDTAVSHCDNTLLYNASIVSIMLRDNRIKSVIGVLIIAAALSDATLQANQVMHAWRQHSNYMRHW